MPSSSLGSLSPLGSPSPSPPPQPTPADVADHPHSSSQTADGPLPLDTDGSELSELSEDENSTPGAIDPTPTRIITQRPRRNTTGSSSTNTTTRPTRTRKPRSGIIPPQMWDWAIKKASEREEEEEEEVPHSPQAMEEEEDEDAPNPSPAVVNGVSDSSAPPRRRAAATAANAALAAAVDPPRIDSEDEDYDYDDSPPTAPAAAGTLRRARVRPRNSRAAADDDEDEDDEVSEEEDEYAYNTTVDDTRDRALESDGTEDEDEEEEDAQEDDAALAEDDMDEDAPPLVAVAAVTAPKDALLEVAVDVTAPPPSAGPAASAAAAASSIMAGSGVVEEEPSSSANTSPTSTPASSRSASPVLGKKSAPTSPGKPVSKANPTVDKANMSITSSVGAKSQVESVTVAEEGDDAAREDVDVEDEPDADADLLQPAHRAEALDVLAMIELKFAMLRQRLYVEKMDDLAVEEKWVEEGTHPELIYIQRELQDRRDKCLELANRKRAYEVETIIKRREVEEHAVWSTWKFQRDQLQTDMIAETSRKRRRLEREQRALQKPIPVRRIPKSPTEVAMPPTLREIVKAYPFMPSSPAERTRSTSKKRQTAAANTVYPELSSLPPSDVQNDLDFLFQHRRNFEHHRQLQADFANGLIRPAPGLMPQHPYDMSMNGAMMNGPRHPGMHPEMGLPMDPRAAPQPQMNGPVHPSAFAPPPPPGMHAQPPTMYGPGPPLPPPPSRLGPPIAHHAHQRPPPGPPMPGAHAAHPGQYAEMEQNGMLQHSVPPQAHIFGHPPLPHATQPGMRRSPSPSLMGHGVHPTNGWSEDAARRAEVDSGRRRERSEREREGGDRKREQRDRDAERRERERGRDRERDRHMDMIQQQQGTLPPRHPSNPPAHHHHVLQPQGHHGPPGNHPPPHHHHHHHHHVLHHHGPPPSQGLPPLRNDGPLPPPLTDGPGQRLPHSREFDGRSGPSGPSEAIHLAPVGGHPSKPPPYWSRDEYPPNQAPPAPADYAPREREQREWEHRQRERSRPPSRPLHEDRMVTPFVLPPSAHTQGPSQSPVFGTGPPGHARRESYGSNGIPAHEELGRPRSAPTPPNPLGGKMQPPSAPASSRGTPLIPSPARSNRPLPPLSPSMAGTSNNVGPLGSPSRDRSLPSFATPAHVAGIMSPSTGDRGKSGNVSPALPPLSGPGLAPLPVRRPSASELPPMDPTTAQSRGGMMSPAHAPRAGSLGPASRLLEPINIGDRHSPRVPQTVGSGPGGPPPPSLAVPPQAQKMSSVA